MKKAELNKIRKDKKVTHCYIKKDGYYYRPLSCGYTEFVANAGVYEKSDAILSAERCEDLYLIPIDTEIHNKMIKTEVIKLISNII